MVFSVFLVHIMPNVYDIHGQYLALMSKACQSCCYDCCSCADVICW